VKVLDFGIAARTESADAHKEQKLTQQGMVLGTPPYMSPEQFTGKALDKRSDIYSLGVLAYEMLTGRLPFQADTPWQWATQHMTAQPMPFEVSAPSLNIPEGMRRAILRALSKERGDRQESARAFFAELGEGNLTAEQGARGAAGTGTAAMGRAPDFSAEAFGGGVLPTAGMPGPAPYAPAGHGPGPGAHAPVVAHAVPAPGRRSGGGKGLIIGLAAAGGVLLVVIVIVLAASMKPEPEEALINPLTSSSAVATIAPQVDVPPETPVASTPSADAGVDERSPATTQKPKPKPLPTPRVDPKPDPKPAPGPTGSAACEACIAAAQSGSLQAAAGHFNRCDDASKKQRCRALSVSKAPGLVRAAAFNGNCAQAKALAAAARAMGGGDLSSSMGSCK
jgi:serine/threonine-protein kinase